MIARIVDWLSRLVQNRRALSSLIVPAIVAAAAAVLAVLAINNVAVLTSTDQFVSDWQVASIAPREPQDPNIVIVTITEDTLAKFPYRSPVDREFIANVVKKVADAKPRSIGIDLLFDQPTEEGKDALLKKTLAELPVPLAVAYTETKSVVTEGQSAFLADFVPPRMRALVNLATDQFDEVRQVFPGARGADGQYIPSLPRMLAEAAGAKTSDEQIPIAWHGKPSEDEPAFREYPSHLVQILPPSFFKDKIVLIGTNITLVDRHRTPYSTTVEKSDDDVTLPGVVIQAHAVAQFLAGRSAPRVPWQIDLIIAFAAGALGALLGMITLHLAPRLAAGFSSVIAIWAAGMVLFHYTGVMIGLIAPTVSLASSLWAMEALSGHEARRQRQFIQGAFSRYVSPKVVERLIDDPTKMSLEGERRIMSYMFTDIAGFTTMSEQLETRELARLLNAYLDGITEIILKLDGMVDKYIGDAVFAIFNAPVDLPDHAERAVRCALEVDAFCEDFRKNENAKGIPLDITRIGVHMGPAVIGNFGSRNRFTYTAEGDAVNVASRLEGVNKYFGTRISVSDAARRECKDIHFRPIASVVLKGKTEAIKVWEPLPHGHATHAFIERYAAAFAKLETNSTEAKHLFTLLKHEMPDDPCVELHLSRLHKGERGVEIVMTEK